jgi:hypothetical protein
MSGYEYIHGLIHARLQPDAVTPKEEQPPYVAA